MSASKAARALLVISCSGLLSSCAHQPAATGDDLPGFFSGWFHGAFALVSLVASLFTDVRIYQFPNSGFGYDAGFMLAVIGWAALFASKDSR